MDWKSSLSSYQFFIEVIRAFGYDNLLRVLFENNQVQIVERIKDISSDLGAIGRLLNSVNGIDKKTAEKVLTKTQDALADKIKDSTDPEAIGWLLGNVSGIDKETARKVLTKTQDALADKIKDSANLGAIGSLLSSVRGIDKGTAKWLEKETGR